MAIKLAQGFQITSANPIDTRLVLSKAEMAAINDKLMPSKYFALCSDDNQIYNYDKTRTASAETGKFQIVSNQEDFLIRGYYLNEKFYTDSTYTVECEKKTTALYVDLNGAGGLYTYNGTVFQRCVQNASETIAGIMKLYTNGGLNEDGTMTQKAITEGVQSIKFAVETIADEDGDGVGENVLILDLPWD